MKKMFKVSHGTPRSYIMFLTTRAADNAYSKLRDNAPRVADLVRVSGSDFSVAAQDLDTVLRTMEKHS